MSLSSSLTSSSSVSTKTFESRTSPISNNHKQSGYNFGIGPLAYTIAREMAVGVNQNKIMSSSIVAFYFVTWAFSFTAPYLYYDAGLGPMICFVYAGTTSLTLLYTWFCVGETAGRSSIEISHFFTERIPVRQWKTHVFDSLHGGQDKKVPYDSEVKDGVSYHVDTKA